MRQNIKCSDNELVASYLKGNVESLEVLINRYKGKVYSYILMVVKDATLADDIFQDTFIKAIQTLRSGVYKDEGKFLQWINRIAHNLIIDSYRKNQRIGVDAVTDMDKMSDTTMFAVESIEQTMIQRQDEERVKKLINMLPPEQGEVVKLRIYCDLSFKDIAALTNVSINTALGRMRYAIINLRKILEEQNASVLES